MLARQELAISVMMKRRMRTGVFVAGAGDSTAINGLAWYRHQRKKEPGKVDKNGLETGMQRKARMTLSAGGRRTIVTCFNAVSLASFEKSFVV